MTHTVSTTKVPATDTRGARICARSAGYQLTVSYPYAARDPHWHVACQLGDRMGVSVIKDPHSETVSGRGYTFATVPR